MFEIFLLQSAEKIDIIMNIEYVRAMRGVITLWVPKEWEVSTPQGHLSNNYEAYLVALNLFQKNYQNRQMQNLIVLIINSTQGVLKQIGPM